jgi:beta-phosphoglucomutase family hydrolase
VTDAHPAVDWRQYDGVLFDLDGVLTATARLHAACWKRMFDEFLAARAARESGTFRPFDIATDYPQFVDGKPRYDGVRSFLESRAIALAEGEADDPPGRETVTGLGNRKNDLIRELLATEGVDVYGGSVALVRYLRAAGVKTAVVTSSRNAEAVLGAAGIADLFDLRIDGNVATARGLPGKPAPDTFLAGAEALGVEPRRAVVVEDAIAGVAAGRAGHFGLVIGVDREGRPEALRAAGADIVVADLAELMAD